MSNEYLIAAEKARALRAKGVTIPIDLYELFMQEIPTTEEPPDEEETRQEGEK